MTPQTQPAAEPSAAFKDYATGTAFSISLSKPQIDCLCQIEQRGGSWQLLTTSYALQRKGLIERKFDSDAPHRRQWSMRLTEAGKAVVPLIKLAGLWVEYEPLPEPIPIPAPEARIKIEIEP